MSLQMEINELNASLRQQLPPEMMQLIDDGIAAIVATGVEEKLITVGTEAPDFTLGNATGGEVSLSSLRRRGPVVLSFNRGNW